MTNTEDGPCKKGPRERTHLRRVQRRSHSDGTGEVSSDLYYCVSEDGQWAKQKEVSCRRNPRVKRLD